MIWWFILISVVALILNKSFLFRSNAERNYKNALKQLQENLDKYKKSSNGSKFSERDIQETTIEIIKLVETHEMFLHLKEKYRHTSTNKKVASDWLTYTRISLKMREYDMDFMMLSNDKLLEEAREKFHADRIRMEEIENRFKKLYTTSRS